MGKVEYSDIVFFEKMSEIKTTIRNSGFPIDYEKAYRADEQMKSIIEELYNPDTKNRSLIELYQKLNKTVKGLISYNLIIYYFALYNENIELLKKLLEIGHDFTEENLRENCYIFDKEFSKYFAKEQYLFLIENCNEELSNFYELVNKMIPVNTEHLEQRKKLIQELNQLNRELFNSKITLSEEEKKIKLLRLKELANLLKTFREPVYSKEEKDKYFKSFATIMTNNPFICKKEEDISLERHEYLGFITPELIDAIGVERILKLTDKEKEILSNISLNNKEELERAYHIIKKHPDISSQVLISEIIKNMTDEEISSLTEKERIGISKAINIGEIKRIVELRRKGFNIEKNIDIISPIVFASLSDENLILLTDKEKKKIVHIISEDYKKKKEKSELIAKCKRVKHKEKGLEFLKTRFKNNYCI